MLFIHIPKNGGTSIRRTGEAVVSNYGYTQSFHNLDNSAVSHALNRVNLSATYGHCRYRDIRNPKKHGQAFAVVRNPWSREVSKYRHLMENPKPKAKAQRENLENNYGVTDFESWLNVCEEFNKVKFTFLHATENAWNQLEWMVDDEGEVQCDILRFERFSHDYNRYMKKPMRQHINNMNFTDYQSLYTDKLINKVADIYSKDIEYFGFDFDTSATRNTYYED